MITKDMICKKMIDKSIQFAILSRNSFICCFGDKYTIRLHVPNQCKMNAEDYLGSSGIDFIAAYIFNALECMRKDNNYPFKNKKYAEIEKWFVNNPVDNKTFICDFRVNESDIKTILQTRGYQGTPEQIKLIQTACNTQQFSDVIHAASRTYIENMIKQLHSKLDEEECDPNTVYLVVISNDNNTHPATDTLFHTLKETKKFMEEERKKCIAEFKKKGLSAEAESDATSWTLRGPEGTIHCCFYRMKK